MSTRLKLLFAVGIFNYAFAKAQITFSDQAAERGADIVYGELGFGAGISFFDYNGDGLDDITLAASPTKDFQFLKNIGGSFVIDNLNISSYGSQTRQSIWVDYDNDGDNDFFAASDTDVDRLYRNNGQGVFEDITNISGLSTAVFKTFGASWGDYNNDGFLDLYISIRDDEMMDPNRLYMNNGDGTFIDVTFESGLELSGYLSFCASWFDYNNDGFQDLYVANDRFLTHNLLYKNNGDGTFTNRSEESGAGLIMDAMSTTIDDFNNDGWFDIYVTNTYPPIDEIEVNSSAFLRNNGGVSFTDISEETGTDFLADFGWGAVFLDADNDMDHDLFVNGVSITGDLPSAALYERTSDISFTYNQDAGFDTADRQSYANALGDIDNDGLPDVVAMNGSNDEIYLWQNTSNTSFNWLKVNLEGTTSNRMGIGSVIELSVDGQKQFHYTICGEGYLSQNSGTEFFGLGTASSIDYVKVTWLSGIEDVIENVDVNQSVTIVEGEGSLSVDSFKLTDFELYPNPSDSMITIRCKKNQDETIKIYDVLGNLITKQVINDEEAIIDISTLQSGLYLVSVGTTTKKLIIK